MAKRKTYSLNALATETGRNFRTLSRALADVKPDGKSADGKPRWYLATAISALAERERQTGRVSSRPAPERYDPVLEAQIREIEVTGAALDAFFVRLRGAATVEERRQMVEVEGKCVGAFERSLVDTIGTGADRPLRQVYIDEMLRGVLVDVAGLCEWSVADLAA